MIEIKKLRPGNYIMHKGEPFLVTKNQIVVTGTHSHTKNKLDLKGLFNNKSESVVLPPHDRLDDINIARKKAQLLSKNPTSLHIMDLVSYETFDAILNSDIELNEGDEVTYIEFNNNAVVMDKRN